jgi:creatinine amidohydrolase
MAAEMVADDLPVAVLPCLWLGMSEHHLPFGGTISLDAATYIGVIGAVARSLKALGFQRLLIVNGHGGNIDALALAARELAVAHDLPIVTTMPWIMPAEGYGDIVETPAPKHACEGEASLMLALAPELVRTENFAAAVGGRLERTAAYRLATRRVALLLLRRARTDDRHHGRPASSDGGERRADPGTAGARTGQGDPR